MIAAETDKVTERALATFGPGERETVIRALPPSGAISPGPDNPRLFSPVYRGESGCRSDTSRRS